MVLRICIVILSLACIVTGMGWRTARGELEAGNEQYAYSVEEVSRLAKIANGQVVLTNQKIGLANTDIGQLKVKLTESERLVAYWRGKVNPREFESLDGLKAWLALDDSDSTLYIFGSGCLGAYDCDDYAVALVHNALLAGYSVSLQIEGDHMLNSTVIGNKIYFIEPQTDEVWFWGYRD